MKELLIFTTLLVVLTAGFGVYVVKKGIKGQEIKKVLGMNIASFFVLLIAATVAIFGGSPAFAAETAAAAGSTVGDGLKFIGAAMSTGLACVGAGIATGAAASAAIGAVSEDPKALGKMFIFIGLSEGIAIYGLIISIMILGN